MLLQIGKSFDLQQVTAGGSRAYALVLEDPGAIVRNKDCIDAGSQRRVNVGLRTIADHPSGIRGKVVLGNNASIGWSIFLCHNLDCRKIFLEPGALYLSRLLGKISLGHEDEMMLTFAQVTEGCRNAFDQFNGI